ncbi:MAG TPA: hypothetical protein VFR02_01745, partial [bacterium]|nr:hypothetical protein [bacterium]
MKRAFRSFSRREWVLGGACLVWLGWVFWRHSTLPSLGDLAFLGELRAGLSEAHGAQAFANLTAALPAWSWALGALVTMAALGKRLSGWLGAPPMNRALGLAQAFGLGMIALTTLWLGLGLNGLWERPVFVGSALGGLAWGVRSLTRRSPVRPPRMPFWAWGPALLAGLLLLLALAQSLVPEAYFDGLVYHLSVPRFWLDRHGLLDDPTCFHSYYPFGAEIYFLNGFWSGDPAGAKLLNTASLVLAALAAGGWAAEAAGPAWGFLTGASLFFVPWVSTTVWTTQNEVVLGLFLLLCSYCAKRWAEADPAARRPWAWGMGLMGGAAWTVKYTALPAFVALAAALWLRDRRVFSRER